VSVAEVVKANALGARNLEEAVECAPHVTREDWRADSAREDELVVGVIRTQMAASSPSSSGSMEARPWIVKLLYGGCSS
jgi:hypothetical protein